MAPGRRAQEGLGSILKAKHAGRVDVGVWKCQEPRIDSSRLGTVTRWMAVASSGARSSLAVICVCQLGPQLRWKDRKMLPGDSGETLA